MARNGDFEFDDLRPHALAVNVQTGHCDGQREPPGTCAARVQEHDIVTVLDSRTVRVASDDAVKLRRGRVEIELTQIVQDIEEDATDLNNLRSRERDGPARDVQANLLLPVREILPSVEAMVIVFPDSDGPNSFERSTVMVSLCPSTVICTFFM